VSCAVRRRLAGLMGNDEHGQEVRRGEMFWKECDAVETSNTKPHLPDRTECLTIPRDWMKLDIIRLCCCAVLRRFVSKPDLPVTSRARRDPVHC
jgi:hypothetical protein